MKCSNNKMYLGRGNSLNRGDVDVLSWICAINKKICRDKWSSSLFVCIPNNCALLVNSFSVVFKLLLLFTSLTRSLFFYWSACIKPSQESVSIVPLSRNLILDFDIRFWFCSDSVVFLCFSFYQCMKKVINFLCSGGKK